MRPPKEIPIYQNPAVETISNDIAAQPHINTGFIPTPAMCTAEQPPPDHYDDLSNSWVPVHFSSTPPLTALPASHRYMRALQGHSSLATDVYNRVVRLYRKHRLHHCPHRGLFLEGLARINSEEGRDKTMILVLELKPNDMARWQEFDADARAILRDCGLDGHYGVCVRYYRFDPKGGISAVDSYVASSFVTDDDDDLSAIDYDNDDPITTTQRQIEQDFFHAVSIRDVYTASPARPPSRDGPASNTGRGSVNELRAQIDAAHSQVRRSSGQSERVRRMVAQHRRSREESRASRAVGTNLSLNALAERASEMPMRPLSPPTPDWSRHYEAREAEFGFRDRPFGVPSKAISPVTSEWLRAYEGSGIDVGIGEMYELHPRRS